MFFYFVQIFCIWHITSRIFSWLLLLTYAMWFMSVFFKNLKILCLNIEISCFAGTHTTTKKMLLKTQIVFLRSDKIIIATQTLDYFQKRLICFKQITARKLKKRLKVKVNWDDFLKSQLNTRNPSFELLWLKWRTINSLTSHLNWQI